MFSDSFEDWYLAYWQQDMQYDWWCSGERATDGFVSAGVDGGADDATLTLGAAIDLSAVSDATLTFSWYIESGLDSGEYLACDLWNGATWNEVARLRGNEDPENVWQNEEIDLGGYLTGDFKLRFRGSMSLGSEDAYVDLVRVTAVPLQ